jgi:Rrf2 family protein
VETFLSQTAEYAMRAVAWFATQAPESRVRARDLSEATEIPADYLSKILRRLVLAGLLVSRKGQGGGFALGRRPDQISFRDVLEAVDAYPREDRCAFGWGSCDASHPCPLHGPWTRMSQEFREWASTTTFADVSPGTRRRARRRRRATGSRGRSQ